MRELERELRNEEMQIQKSKTRPFWQPQADI
jgi:hypothetical protein